MKSVTLGDVSVSAEGLGCMGMSSAYGSADWDESVVTIRRALDLGINLIDTAASYGSGHNEVLVGRAIAGRRDEVRIASKAGVDLASVRGRMVLRGDPDYLKASVDASLLRLGVEHIDIYYLHRVSPDTPLQDSVGALRDLVQEGKIGAIGLCEVDSQQLRDAAAIHPIAAVQSEYSLWTRDPEDTVLEAARQLGVGLVAYSPLGRGFLTGTVSTAALAADDGRRKLARFADAAAAANAVITEAVQRVASRLGVTAAQAALAWTMNRGKVLGVPVIPIPGTKRVRWLEQNAAAAEVTLSATDVEELDGLADRVTGGRF